MLEHARVRVAPASSVEATLPGFIHDHCAGFNPMTVASPAIRELELEAEGLEWIPPDAIMAHPFEDGTAIVLHHRARADRRLTRGGGSGSGSRVARIDRAVPAARAAAGGHDPRPAAAGARVRQRSASRCAGTRCCSPDGWRDRSRRSASMCSTGRRRPTAWLAGSAQHSGLAPSTAGSGAFGFLLALVAHSHGWPFPAGGQQRIADALLAIAHGRASCVRCGAHVDRVIVRRGRVAGVALGDGEEIAARDVVTTISARPLAALLPAEALPDRLLRRLRIWRYSTAAFKVDYALRAPVPWTADPARRAAVVHVGGELRDLAAAAEAGQRGDMPERPRSSSGSTRCSTGHAPRPAQHTLYCYAHVPARYRCSDEDVADLIEAQLERFAPGFSGAVIARATRNPQRDRGGESESRRRRPRRWKLRTRPAAAVPACARAVPPPHTAPGAVRRRRVRPPRWLGARDGWSLRRAGAARRPPAATLAGLSAPMDRARAAAAQRLQDPGFGDPPQTPKRLDVAPVNEGIGQAVEHELREGIAGDLGHRHARAAVVGLKLEARRSRFRAAARGRGAPTGEDGSTSSTSVWSLTVSGATPTRW